ncbi:helix-turn-helix domain-containing protein, partial [Hyella patelloides]|uniref:helix-turn-helix domain-containing protein n=1 Tax=Hyella patelloides TaxID=1982969 RepID=UPI001C95DE9D
MLWKVSLGWTIKNSAVAVGINYDYAQKIVSKYNKQGSESVKNGHKKPKKPTRGRKSLLTQEQLEKLKQELESLPSAEEGIWTGAKVARWIEKETGREKVGNQRGWDYLKKCKYSWQTPRPQHNKGDKLEQEIFKA